MYISRLPIPYSIVPTLVIFRILTLYMRANDDDGRPQKKRREEKETIIYYYRHRALFISRFGMLIRFLAE